MEKTMRQRIKTMKEIKEKHNLTNAQIMDIVAENGGYVSDRTVQKIFAENSENKTFQYQSIAQIYEALVSVYGEGYTTEDTLTLKHIISERNKHIDSLIIQMEDQHAECKKRLELYEERKANYEKTIFLLEAQIQRLEKLLDNREELFEKMLNKYVIDIQEG